VSNGLISCVSALDYNLLVNTKRTFRGEGFSEGLHSIERKCLLLCLRDYLAEKWYISGVVLGRRERCLDVRASIIEVAG
jgi:hypothetical protein